MSKKSKYHELAVFALKTKCRDAGLIIGGSRDEIITRLEAHDARETEEAAEIESPSQIAEKMGAEPPTVPPPSLLPAPSVPVPYPVNANDDDAEAKLPTPYGQKKESKVDDTPWLSNPKLMLSQFQEEQNKEKYASWLQPDRLNNLLHDLNTILAGKGKVEINTENRTVNFSGGVRGAMCTTLINKDVGILMVARNYIQTAVRGTGFNVQTG